MKIRRVGLTLSQLITCGIHCNVSINVPLLLPPTAPSRKDDSLKLDVIPESIIRGKLIDGYDKHLVLVTEEKGEYNFSEIASAEIVAFSDPTDRSKQFKLFLEDLVSNHGIDPNACLNDIEASVSVIDKWNVLFGTPTRITGACCSVTMVKRGEILFSMVLNYITQELFIACDSFVGSLPTKEIRYADGEYNYDQFHKIVFPRVGDNNRRFITYLGKEIYEKGLDRTKLIPAGYTFGEIEPGGPLRIFYLSDVSDLPVEFIMSNGEKIGEWLGWLAFCKYSKELVVYSVYPESDFSQKDDILMYPSPPYSILESSDNKLLLNYSKLRYFPNPSRYSELILITHKDNYHLQAIIDANASRQLM